MMKVCLHKITCNNSFLYSQGHKAQNLKTFRFFVFSKICKHCFFNATIPTQDMESEMAMDLCIDEKDEERESEAQSAVRAKKRARGGWGVGAGRALLRPHV